MPDDVIEVKYLDQWGQPWIGHEIKVGGEWVEIARQPDEAEIARRNREAQDFYLRTERAERDAMV